MLRLHNTLSTAGAIPALQNPIAGFQPAGISRNLARKRHLRGSVCARRNRWAMECLRPSLPVVISSLWLNTSARCRPLIVPSTGESRPTIRAGETILVITSLTKSRENNAETSRIKIAAMGQLHRVDDPMAARYGGEFIQAPIFKTFRCLS